MKVNQICPNCGARMERDKFMSVCEYCGVAFADGKSANTIKNDSDTGNTRKHYDYIVSNEARISQCEFVELHKKDNGYVIVSTPFYSNDGFLTKISSFQCQLKFKCDGKTEDILIGILGKRPATRLALQTESKKKTLSLQLHNYSEGYTWFTLSEAQLLSVCTAQTIDLSTDLPIPDNANFNELPFFASRFYNVAFNRMKFQYSTHVKLITDK